jgi:lysozyme
VIPEGVRQAIELIKRWEGFRSQPYLCPAGVPTIGYGSTKYPDGRAVQLTDSPVTRAEAERILLITLYTEYLPAVLRQCPTIDTEGRLAAIVDFTYNLGERNLAASTLRKRILAEQWEDVPAQLMRWRFAGGRELRGLVLRRQAEAALI